MRKDYLPVSAALAVADQTARVEQQWTQTWRQRPLPADGDAYVKRQEEFRLMDPYLKRLPAGSRLLDGGCGLGEWVRYYTTRGFDVTGLDLSRETVQRLQASYPGHRFVAGDIRSIAYADGAFDAYFSWGTFEHFEEGLGVCLKEAWRVLRPGGLLFISVPFQNRRHLRNDRRPLWRWDEAFHRTEGDTPAMRFYQWRFTRPELQRELAVHGFRTLMMRPIHKDSGIHRMLKNDWRVSSAGVERFLRLLLRPLMSGAEVAHMMFAAAQKPGV